MTDDRRNETKYNTNFEEVWIGMEAETKNGTRISGSAEEVAHVLRVLEMGLIVPAGPKEVANITLVPVKKKYKAKGYSLAGRPKHRVRRAQIKWGEYLRMPANKFIGKMMREGESGERIYEVLFKVGKARTAMSNGRLRKRVKMLMWNSGYRFDGEGYVRLVKQAKPLDTMNDDELGSRIVEDKRRIE